MKALEVFTTYNGANYVNAPRCEVIAETRFDAQLAARAMTELFDGASSGIRDYAAVDDTTDAEYLSQFAGQLCYLSFGEKRTPLAENRKYLERIMESAHGSVFEHSSYSVLFFGIDRATTHELVRHRAGTAFCLSGDTLIYSERGATAGRKYRDGAKKRTLKSLYEMTQTPHGRSRLKLLRLRVLDETSNTFTRGRVKTVVCSGVKPVYKVTLEDGKTITATKEHRFLTPNGWNRLSDIVGTLELRNGKAVYTDLTTPILVNGLELYKDKAWLEEQYIRNNLEQATIGALAGVSKHTVRTWIRKFQLQKPAGSWTAGRKPWNAGLRYANGPTHSEAAKAIFRQNKLGAKNPNWRGGVTKQRQQIAKECHKFRAEVYAADDYACRLCRQKGGKLALHHILPVWYRPDLATQKANLATVCAECHEQRLNNHELEFVEFFGIPKDQLPPGRKRATNSKVFSPRPVNIKQIEYAGEQMTYDIEMEGANHNFVANGIVTHNSQVSQRYVDDEHLRFVLPYEYSNSPKLIAQFEKRIDRALEDYRVTTHELREVIKRNDGESATEYRKRIQSCSREVLPNCTEAPIIITANVRAWRHIFSMRCSAHADVRVRRPMIELLKELQMRAPNLFCDFKYETLRDGTQAASSRYPKV